MATYGGDITTFTADTTAIAIEVNDNFTSVFTALNALDAANLTSGTIDVARISDLTSTQMASTYFRDQDDLSADSDTSVASQQSIKAYVDARVGHDGDGFAYFDVDGSKTKVYTKYLTGNLGAGSATSVAHGVSSGLTKILAVTVSAYDDSHSRMQVAEMFAAASSAHVIYYSWDGTNVMFTGVAAAYQSNRYVIRVDYIL